MHTVIYTLRNPKDVLVSFYHLSKFFKSFKDPGTVEEFLEEFLSGNVAFGSWFDHVKSWLEVKGRPNVFFNSYEELQQDLRGSVEKICLFLGKELNSQQIDSVVENASFQKMKDNPKSNFTTGSDDTLDHKKGKFLRKGKSRASWVSSVATCAFAEGQVADGRQGRMSHCLELPHTFPAQLELMAKGCLFMCLWWEGHLCEMGTPAPQSDMF
ncbi:sulfotransferase 2B1-like [Elgaria multicarinata webbii]|uniref:sulfotransferase 2B1-like n=1 Tax=Elgaria multicarinata webbii TaxID=159646 RepID=UPI002FCCF763